MATYYHGNPEIQEGDHGLQTLVLMNPAYLHQYSSDTSTHPPPPPPNNLVFLNSNSPSPPSPHTSQQFFGIPLPAASTTSFTNQHDISPLHGLVHRLHYNNYNSINDPDYQGQGQGLSLSLSNSQLPAQPGYGSQAQAIPGDHQDMRFSGGGSASLGSGVTNNGVTGMKSRVLLSSKYLKAAQEVLDEVVSVNNSGILNTQLSKKDSEINSNISSKAAGEVSAAAADGPGDHGDGGGGKSGAELTASERQEIQMKKAKLISMLDEVDQRYKQYHEQMEIVVSSFEQAAGIGSSKTYTALALKTISKQFRYLKEAISGQIQAANKSLGEEDCVGGKIEGSRLKFVDHHLRQQRALQQLGMIQHNAWRPQRGLPERSVSVLRAWLFEHFLHPYPKDSDKIMLAKQTGLTRSQVSNWFINARVRLWKPMVEEMYNEELKEHEQNGSEDKTRNNQNQNQSNENSSSKSTTAEKSPSENQTKSFSSEQDNNPSNQSISTASIPSLGGNVRNQSAGGLSLLGSSELECLTQASPKKQRSTEMLQSPTSVQSINMDSIEQSEVVKNGYSFMGTNTNTNFMGSFGQYPAIGEMGRFDAEQFAPRFSGNGVSLTLGLPHCENLSLSGAHHQTFIPNQNMPMGTRLDIAIGEPNEYGAINPSTPHSNINFQNRKGFAAQLLPDFVA